MRRSSFALVSLLLAGVVAVAPAAGAPEQSPRRGGTIVVGSVAELRNVAVGPFSVLWNAENWWLAR
jgi:hypothetical protein